MKQLVQIFLLISAVNSNGQSPSFMWARNFGSIDSEAMNTLIDLSGNSFTTGVFQGYAALLMFF